MKINYKGILVNKYFLLISICTTMIGCASHKYGYTAEDWNGLTQLEKIRIETEASENLNRVLEEEREKIFQNRPLNKILGSRSNVF